MWLPLVSIILPAYNCEKYIATSVDSILKQVYDNFELLVVNDGSTDSTASILASIADPRLRVLNNEQNKGLIFSLNRAIEESKGEFIARMDADDIAMNDRIEKQVHWLLHHPGTAAVATFIRMIDEQGNEKPAWTLDRKTFTADAIKKAMPVENCIAHPTIMIRSAVLKQYRYAANQPNIEDYDLWLRMLGDGLVIDKIPQSLLDYRVHSGSVTSNYLKKNNPFLQNYACKKRFLRQRRPWKKFECKVALMMVRDKLMALLKTVRKPAL